MPLRINYEGAFNCIWYQSLNCGVDRDYFSRIRLVIQRSPFIFHQREYQFLQAVKFDFKRQLHHTTQFAVRKTTINKPLQAQKMGKEACINQQKTKNQAKESKQRRQIIDIVLH